MPAGEVGDVFEGVADRVPVALADHLRSVQLVDHHVHGAFNKPVDRAGFEASINEGSTDPVPDFMTMFDSPLGLAIRRWCAPVLGLTPNAAADEYWSRRSELGPDELTTTMLRQAGVSRWVVDTGFKGDLLTTPERMADLSGAPASSILRLERLAEDLLETGTDPDDFPDAFRSALQQAVDSKDFVGTKTIAAYRTGFDIDWSRPTDVAVVEHARALAGQGNQLRLDSPVADRLRRARGGRARATDTGARRVRRPGPRPEPDRSPVDAAAAAHHDAGPGAAAALLPVPSSGRLPRAGVRSREFRCGPCHQLSRRCGQRRWSPRRSTRRRSPNSCTSPTLSGRRSCTCSVRCCGAARWGWSSASGCARATAANRMRSPSST